MWHRACYRQGMATRTRWVWVSALLLALAWGACTLNPQPLPPALDGKASSADAGATSGDQDGDASPKPHYDAGAEELNDGGLEDAGSSDAGADGSDAAPIQDAGRD